MTATKSAEDRSERLLPGGIPKYVRVYDNGGKTFDRYTCVFTGKSAEGACLGMSEHPAHPQGFGQHGQAENSGGRFRAIDVNKAGWAPAVGRSNHLGKRIRFEDLPEDCRKLVMSDYADIYRV